MMKLNQYKILILSLLGCIVTPLSAVEAEIKEKELIFPQPTQNHVLSTKKATKRLIQSHYHKFSLDDNFSNKIFDRYLNWLDNSHNTFLQSDVDEMRTLYASLFDDDLVEGNLEHAFSIHERLIKRRYERFKYALTLLDKEPDLTTDEQIENDRTKAPWPISEEDANNLWKQRVKNDVINLYLKGKNWAEVKKILTKRYNLAIRRLIQVKSDDILQLFLNAFTKEIDPHTSYLSPRAEKAFQESMNLSLEGIGATLATEDDMTVIKSLVPGAPAALSKKLNVEDKIVGVGQEKGEIEDVIGWRIEDVVDKIKGKKGTKVRLEIEPAKGGKNKIVTLVRDKVRLEDSAAKLTIETVDNKKIAVLKIPTFYIGLTDDVMNLLAQPSTQKTDGLIIDLRDNGGGSLGEVISLTGLFIQDGPVVQVRDAYQRIIPHEDYDEKIYYTHPVIVMVNRYSASASEIFSAAMQDYNRAIIIGQKTFGKGTVQQGKSLTPNYTLSAQLGMLQYTIQKFYRINGGSTQLKGVDVDIKFPALINEEKIGESFEDNALPWDKIPAAEYKMQGNARQFIDILTQKHLARIENDPEFIALKKEIGHSREKDNQKFSSLNFKHRQQENELDEQMRLDNLNSRFKREGKKLLKNLDELPKNYVAPDFFLKESEQIMLDWINLQK